MKKTRKDIYKFQDAFLEKHKYQPSDYNVIRIFAKQYNISKALQSYLNSVFCMHKTKDSSLNTVENYLETGNYAK